VFTEGLVLFIDESVSDPSMASMSEAGRVEAIRRARLTGKRTMYPLSIGYQEDRELPGGRQCPCKPGLTWRSTEVGP
jgi:hypothetical protein